MSSMDLDIQYSEHRKNILIMNELEEMKKIDKEIFLLYYFEEKKVREIAVIYGITESKVKSKLYRVRKKISKKIREEGYDIYDWQRIIWKSKDEYCY